MSELNNIPSSPHSPRPPEGGDHDDKKQKAEKRKWDLKEWFLQFVDQKAKTQEKEIKKAIILEYEDSLSNMIQDKKKFQEVFKYIGAENSKGLLDKIFKIDNRDQKIEALKIFINNIGKLLKKSDKNLFIWFMNTMKITGKENWGLIFNAWPTFNEKLAKEFFFIAVENGNEDVTLQLIQIGINVDVKNSKGRSLLHLALENHFEKAALALIEKGAEDR